LFNSFSDILTLIISTRLSLDDGLGHGIPFIIVAVRDNKSASVDYYTTTEQWEFNACKSNDIMSTLQPLLDRLWNETRGKKNARETESTHP
jgi:hypothetical protein